MDASGTQTSIKYNKRREPVHRQQSRGARASFAHICQGISPQCYNLPQRFKREAFAMPGHFRFYCSCWRGLAAFWKSFEDTAVERLKSCEDHKVNIFIKFLKY